MVESVRSSSLHSLPWPSLPIMWLKIHLHTEDGQIFTSNLYISPILVQTPKCLLDISTWILRDTSNSPCPKQRYWYSQTYFIQSIFTWKNFHRKPDLPVTQTKILAVILDSPFLNSCWLCLQQISRIWPHFTIWNFIPLALAMTILSQLL